MNSTYDNICDNKSRMPLLSIVLKFLIIIYNPHNHQNSFVRCTFDY